MLDERSVRGLDVSRRNVEVLLEVYRTFVYNLQLRKNDEIVRIRHLTKKISEESYI